jgi:hypothetical protein
MEVRMRSIERRPTWQHDVRWLAALFLVVVVAAAAAASSLARLTAAVRVDPLAREALTLAVGPTDAVVRLAPTSAGYQTGTPLALLPGVPVQVDPSEIPAFDVPAGVSRVAGVLTERYVSQGGPTTWAGIEDETWRQVLERIDAAVLRPLLVNALAPPLFAVGVGDGSLLADWPLQASQQPGQAVQPLVGVLVTLPPLALQGRNAREIGEAVVAELAAVLADDGADAARALVPNQNIATALDTALTGPVRDVLHAALEAVVATRQGEIASRLADAGDVLAGTVSVPDPWARLVDPVGRERLDTAERRQSVLAELSQRAVLGGSDAVMAVLPESGVRERVIRSAPVLDLLDRRAHRRAQVLAWTLGSVALVLSAVTVATASGFGRVTWPGLAWLLGAAPGLAAAWYWRDVAPLEAWPASPAVEGVWTNLADTLRLVLGQLGPVAAETVLWAHLVPAGVGAALVLIGVTGWLGAQVRPARRGRF